MRLTNRPSDVAQISGTESNNIRIRIFFLFFLCLEFTLPEWRTYTLPGPTTQIPVGQMPEGGTQAMDQNTRRTVFYLCRRRGFDCSGTASCHIRWTEAWTLFSSYTCWCSNYWAIQVKYRSMTKLPLTVILSIKVANTRSLSKDYIFNKTSLSGRDIKNPFTIGLCRVWEYISSIRT